MQTWFATLAVQSSETGPSATFATPHSGSHAVQSVARPSAHLALAKAPSHILSSVHANCCIMPLD